MSSTRSPAGTTIKIRAGGSGQSAMVSKPAAAPAAAAPTASAAQPSPAKIVLKPSAAASSSSSAAVSKPVVTLAARPALSGSAAPVSSSSSSGPAGPSGAAAGSSSSPAVPSASKTTPSKPAYTASTSSSSSVAVPKASVAPVVAPAAKSTSGSHTITSSSSSDGQGLRTTPNGINLSLSSADSHAPNLLPPRTRSDRLRAAALAENREEVVALLGMPGGVDVNAQDDFGMTALMLSSSRGAHTIVEELLDIGRANVHLKDRYGLTALHFAAAAASYECVQILVDHKAGVNVVTSKGQSALMKVAYISHPHSALIADFLCRHKAKPDLISADGATAASIAVANDHLEIVQVLAHYGANVNLKIGTPAAATPAAGAASVAAAAVSSGGSSSSAASSAASSKTLLHLAAARGSFTMLSHLVALGADPSAVDGEGKTLLDVPAPASSSGSAASFSPAAFRARLQAAVDAGMAMREEHARVVAENAAIIARLKAERMQRLREEKIQAELQAAADAAALAKASSSSSAATPARPVLTGAGNGGLLSPSRLAIESRVDAELGLGGRKVLYTDDAGVEHYSAPPSPSARLTAEQLRERTYRPKIDPTSVFGDSGSVGGGSSSGAAERKEDEPEELGNGEGSYDDEPTFSYHELLQARLHGTSSGVARTAPVAAPIQDDDEEDQEEMKMVSGNSY